MSLGTQFVWGPPSEEIAKALNAGLTPEGESPLPVCQHGRSPCFVFCGVQKNTRTGLWEPIPPERRAEWFGRVLGLVFRNREMDADGMCRHYVCQCDRAEELAAMGQLVEAIAVHGTPVRCRRKKP